MSDYNDGNWHAWNGGECPVHPKTVVKACFEAQKSFAQKAGDFNWGLSAVPITAFKVVKEHKEPREFWIVPERFDMVPEVWTEKPEATHWCGVKIIHVREVLDNE